MFCSNPLSILNLVIYTLDCKNPPKKPMWNMNFLAKKALTCQKQAQILPVLCNVQILSITPIHTISQNIWNQKQNKNFANLQARYSLLPQDWNITFSYAYSSVHLTLSNWQCQLFVNLIWLTAGWQDLAGFRRGQKWPWNLSSSAYLQFSRQMRRFCA